MSHRFIRNELLLGKDVVEKLNKTKVMVFGLGGVGGYAVEALARLGVGHLIICDKDKVDLSNLNRQIIALESTLGESKVDIFKERLKDINPNIKVDGIDEFFDESKTYLFDKYKPDFVIDAIDTITPKWSLIKTCLDRNITFVSCCGMANKINPLEIELTTLDKTSVDPICKILRNLARKEGYDLSKINVVFSKEIPIKQNQIINESGITRKERIPPSSIILVPSNAGLVCAYFVMDKIINS